jgi:NADH-quinone oxidoreductase subunit M
VTLGVTGLQLVLSLVLWAAFDGNHIPASWADSFQFVTKTSWIRLNLEGIGVLNVDYFIGLDGISLPMVVLSSLILLIGVISSWSIEIKTKGFYVLYLILGASVIGCFAALDFFLFYLFFEFMLLPMFFLIGIWGGKRRQYASVKFFIYTLIGSLFILVVMIALFLSVQENGANTFSLVQMMTPEAFDSGSFLSAMAGNEIAGVSVRAWAFWLLVVGFLIKLPAVPVHTWLPDAHVEAPTAISVVLAGLLLKIGGYGLFRIAFPIFPEQAMAFGMPIAIIGVVAIIYGGMTAMAQTDLKRLVAYSSVSHMGFVLVGLGALTIQGLSGGLFQMVSHGLLSPALFLLVGVLYDRTGDREISNFNGLASHLPRYTFFIGFFFFASLGLPGLSGFVGELLVLLGAFQSNVLATWVGPVAVVGILVSAAYFIWTIQRMFFGKYWVRKKEWNERMIDLTMREWLMLSPLAILVVVLGIFPSIVLGPIHRSIEFWVQQITQVLP